MAQKSQQQERFDGGRNFVQSEVFARTFKEGMSLVEETANYLDGEGRTVSKSLSKNAALSYAGASMRLTTELMQIASWLLVLRAVREGDMQFAEASEDKYRLPPKEISPVAELDGELPQTLLALINASTQLYERIARIDIELFNEATVVHPANDAVAQQKALWEAFASNKR
ncbi:MAG: DUF1465 family protein [Pseudomonadota bacterium]